MSVWLERFGTTPLPLIEASQDIGAVGTRTSYMDLPGGGAFDVYGSDVAPRGQYTLSATGEIGNLPTLAEMLAEADALRALRGRRDKLYARVDDTTVRWTWARLRDIRIQRTVEYVLYLPVDLLFDVVSPVWYGNEHGAGWTFDSGEVFDSGIVFDEATGDVSTLSHTTTTVIPVVNAGNAAIDNAILTITPGAGAITSVHLTADDGAITQSDFTWTGTVPTGYALIIDAGTQSITVTNGTNVYNGLVFNAGHVISGWLRLMPGTTTVSIDITSTTDATITFTYNDGFE